MNSIERDIRFFSLEMIEPDLIIRWFLSWRNHLEKFLKYVSTLVSYISESDINLNTPISRSCQKNLNCLFCSSFQRHRSPLSRSSSCLINTFLLKCSHAKWGSSSLGVCFIIMEEDQETFLIILLQAQTSYCGDAYCHCGDNNYLIFI